MGNLANLCEKKNKVIGCLKTCLWNSKAIALLICMSVRCSTVADSVRTHHPRVISNSNSVYRLVSHHFEPPNKTMLKAL